MGENEKIAIRMQATFAKIKRFPWWVWVIIGVVLIAGAGWLVVAQLQDDTNKISDAEIEKAATAQFENRTREVAKEKNEQLEMIATGLEGRTDAEKAGLYAAQASAYEDLGKIDEAIESARLAIQYDPAQRYYLYSSIAAWLALSDKEAAKQTYDEAIAATQRYADEAVRDDLVKIIEDKKAAL